MQPLAQTNVQLYEQLLGAGYDGPSLARVRAAYEASIVLLSGRCQRSGKCFLSHGVGTGSVLAGLGASASVIAAGILHNAYENGDFGDRRSGATRERRAWIEERIGAEAEARVHGFFHASFRPKALRERQGGLARVSQLERDVLLVFIANELERFHDLGVRYQAKGTGRLQFAERDGECVQQLARELGYPALATDLERAFSRVKTSHVPESLRMRGCEGPFVRLSSSYRW